MEALLATLAGLLATNLFVSVRIYFRLGAHSARLDGQDARLKKLEAKPQWIG